MITDLLLLFQIVSKQIAYVDQSPPGTCPIYEDRTRIDPTRMGYN